MIGPGMVHGAGTGRAVLVGSGGKERRANIMPWWQMANGKDNVNRRIRVDACLQAAIGRNRSLPVGTPVSVATFAELSASPWCQSFVGSAPEHSPAASFAGFPLSRSIPTFPCPLPPDPVCLPSPSGFSPTARSVPPRFLVPYDRPAVTPCDGTSRPWNMIHPTALPGPDQDPAPSP
jgi:hypothetical protein